MGHQNIRQRFDTVFSKYCSVFLYYDILYITLLSPSGQLGYRFGQFDYEGQEGNVVTVEVVKEGTNDFEFFVNITTFTISEAVANGALSAAPDEVLILTTVGDGKNITRNLPTTVCIIILKFKQSMLHRVRCYKYRMYRIAGIIRGGQFSREGEPFVLRGLFAGLKFTDPIPPVMFRERTLFPPLCFAGLFLAGETQPRIKRKLYPRE